MIHNFKVMTAEDFACPNCDTLFSEDDLVELCGEPFNGTIVKCKKCLKEYSCDILIKIEEE